jgi:hypothetical protein
MVLKEFLTLSAIDPAFDKPSSLPHSRSKPRIGRAAVMEP